MTRQRLVQTFCWLAATGALLGVFALYTQPDFLLIRFGPVFSSRIDFKPISGIIKASRPINTGASSYENNSKFQSIRRH